MNYTDLATAVTQQLVTQIETGPETWRMPWHTVPGLFDVRNASTGNRYGGANVVSLGVEALEAEHPTGWWCTYRQWSDLGAQVRKGEKSARVVKWVLAKRKDGATPPAGSDRSEDQKTLVPRVYSVFNAAQVDGWTPPAPLAATEIERNALADSFIANTGAEITYGHNHAAFVPARDVIELPAPEQFADTEALYSTACHELTHWTGHTSRLGRDLTGRFGDDAYAAEELVAELGAAIACAHLGVAPTPRDDHASYLANWLKILNADPKALFAVAAKAQAAVDYLDSLQPEHVAALATKRSPRSAGLSLPCWSQPAIHRSRSSPPASVSQSEPSPAGVTTDSPTPKPTAPQSCSAITPSTSGPTGTRSDPPGSQRPPIAPHSRAAAVSPEVATAARRQHTPTHPSPST